MDALQKHLYGTDDTAIIAAMVAREIAVNEQKKQLMYKHEDGVTVSKVPLVMESATTKAELVALCNESGILHILYTGPTITNAAVAAMLITNDKYIYTLNNNVLDFEGSSFNPIFPTDVGDLTGTTAFLYFMNDCTTASSSVFTTGGVSGKTGVYFKGITSDIGAASADAPMYYEKATVNQTSATQKLWSGIQVGRWKGLNETLANITADGDTVSTSLRGFSVDILPPTLDASASNISRLVDADGAILQILGNTRSTLFASKVIIQHQIAPFGEVDGSGLVTYLLSDANRNLAFGGASIPSGIANDTYLRQHFYTGNKSVICNDSPGLEIVYEGVNCYASAWSGGVTEWKAIGNGFCELSKYDVATGIRTEMSTDASLSINDVITWNETKKVDENGNIAYNGATIPDDVSKTFKHIFYSDDVCDIISGGVDGTSYRANGIYYRESPAEFALTGDANGFLESRSLIEVSERSSTNATPLEGDAATLITVYERDRITGSINILSGGTYTATL